MPRPTLLIVLSLLPAIAHADAAATIQAVYRDTMLHRAAALTIASEQLTAKMESYCTGQAGEAGLEGPHQGWFKAVIRWTRLSSVAIGPVLEQRMARRIDFNPTRPRMILKAIKSAPANAKDMELIGTPAKGFPALEWLLWTQPVGPATPACAYAVQVAREISQESRSMEADFRRLAANEWGVDAAKVALSELVNQWVGGLERLRWANMEMPVRVAGTAGPDAVPEFPRQASRVVAADWAAQWDLLHALAVADGAGSMASLLRDQGKAELAAKLVQAVAQADAGMAGLAPTDKARILATAKDLAALKGLAENEVAPALGVSIGFSDSDGD